MTTITHIRTHDHHQTQEKYWEVRPWKPFALGIALLALPIIFLMLIIGGILFWMPHMTLPGIANARPAPEDSELARDGLGTMKKMVSDNDAWSAAIKQEYEKIYGTNLACGTKTDNLSVAH